MLKIKLTRLGKKSEPRYRIVVNECRDRRDGKYVEQLGVYQPTAAPKILELDLKAYDEWLKKGAQPTTTVAFLAKVVRDGKGFPEKKPSLNKKAKAKKAAAAKEQEEAKVAKEAASAEAPVATPEPKTPPQPEESATKVTPTEPAAPAEASKKD